MDDDEVLLFVVCFWLIHTATSTAAESVVSQVRAQRNYLQGVQIQWQLLVLALVQRGQRSAWTLERPPAYFDHYVEPSSEEGFRKELRVSKTVFEFLCAVVAPALQKQDTKYRTCVPLRRVVAIALKRLGSGMIYKDLGSWFGHGESTVRGVCMNFCHTVVGQLLHVAVRWPSKEQQDAYARGFQKLQGINRCVGAIDGSYIQINPPAVDGENPVDYYCRKGFHAVSLQAVCDSRCYIWDICVGWCGSMHDYNVFGHSPAFYSIAEGKLYNNMLLGDAAYPPRPWMLSPYKGSANTPLQAYQRQFNFRQSSSRMAVERCFGMMKQRFRILLNRVTGSLQGVAEVVGTCAILHNLCILDQEGFPLEYLTGLLHEFPHSHAVQTLASMLPERGRREMAVERVAVPLQAVEMTNDSHSLACEIRDAIAMQLYQA
jgi:hypothetical protein